MRSGCKLPQKADAAHVSGDPRRRAAQPGAAAKTVSIYLIYHHAGATTIDVPPPSFLRPKRQVSLRLSSQQKAYSRLSFASGRVIDVRILD
jgi:hypothetical protein